MAGGEDCLWYVDRNGSWHPGFDCEAFSFCCGSCHQRYCCYDPLRLLTERQQRHCLAFRCPGLHAAGAGSHCWVLGVIAGCWVSLLGAGSHCWVLGVTAGCWVSLLGAGSHCWVVGIHHCWVLGVIAGSWVMGIHHYWESLLGAG